MDKFIFNKPNKLTNFGNSCYFNSSIQFLKPIIDRIVYKLNNTKINSKVLPITLNNLYKNIIDYYSYYNNTNLLKNKFISIANKLTNGGIQQDCTEVIRILINEIKDYLPSKLKYLLSIDIKYNKVIRCANCLRFKICNDGIEQTDDMIISKELNKEYSTIVPFNNLLNDILNCEFIECDSVNEYKRENPKCICNKKEIHIQNVLIDMPEYLIINVNREMYDNNKITKSKNKLEILNSFEITTPDNLKLRCANKQQNNIHHKYKLNSIILHLGNGSSGHYIIYSKDFKSNSWWLCNDDTITEVPNINLDDEIIQTCCTILLYIKE
jgi:ubiquitin C-terminal hydrolase